jgi:drug/metabolite transporter (DMT)-like permease
MENSLIKKEPAKALVFAAFASLYIIWGSTYLAIVIAVKNIPPFMMIGIRFLIAGAILYVWCRLQGQSTPPVKSVTNISFAGLLILFFGNGSLVWVEQYIPTGLAAIIVATVPLWFVLLDKRQWKYHFGNKFIIFGLLIGFAGVLTLFAGNSAFTTTGDPMQLISFFVLLVGTITWAIGSLYSKYKPTEGSTGMKAAIQMIAAGVIASIVGVVTGELNQFSWSNISWEVVAAIVYLITFGSLIGYMSYVWLLTVRPPAQVGTYAYVNPLVAVLLGWLIVDEKITWHQVVALSIILIGVVIVNLSKEKISKDKVPQPAK